MGSISPAFRSSTRAWQAAAERGEPRHRIAAQSLGGLFFDGGWTAFDRDTSQGCCGGRILEHRQTSIVAWKEQGSLRRAR
jgi:hypothetical protein